MKRWILIALGTFLVTTTAATFLIEKVFTHGAQHGVPLAAGLVIGWLVLVVFYYAWAIYRYNINLGLGDEDWKSLGEDDEGPDSNPYQGESFGLPPGTVRGTLALSAMILFLATEIVNLQNPGLEKDVGELITVFQMVLAFYFGARAVEVLEKKKGTAGEAAAPQPADTGETVTPAPAEQKAPSPLPLVATAPVTIPDSGGLDRPAMSSTVSSIRLANVALPGTAIPPPPVMEDAANATLIQRVVALTSSFETGLGFPQTCGVATGNFDGQGLSYGALQWNIGQGTLQQLWQKMQDAHPDVLKQVLGAEYPGFTRMLAGTARQQMDWALSIQHTDERHGNKVWVIADDWKKRLMELGVTKEMVGLQVSEATRRYEIATSNCRIYGLKSQRGLALMFDINVQNGKVDRNGAGANIRADFASILTSLPADDQEIERMRIIANRRADVVDGAFREDVRRRKLTIAEGHGRVHGRDYDLATDFAITLAAA